MMQSNGSSRQRRDIVRLRRTEGAWPAERVPPGSRWEDAAMSCRQDLTVTAIRKPAIFWAMRQGWAHKNGSRQGGYTQGHPAPLAR